MFAWFFSDSKESEAKTEERILSALESLKREDIFKLDYVWHIEEHAHSYSTFFFRRRVLFLKQYDAFLKQNNRVLTRFKKAIEKLRDPRLGTVTTVLAQHMLLKEVKDAYEELLKTYPDLQRAIPYPEISFVGRPIEPEFMEDVTKDAIDDVFNNGMV